MMVYSLLIATVVALQNGKSADQTWIEYTSDEGNFSVEMLGQPHVEKETIETPAGNVTMTTISSRDENSAYSSIYFDYPDALAGRNPDLVLNNIRDGAVSRGKSSSERT